jgi:hypothetical protein
MIQATGSYELYIHTDKGCILRYRLTHFPVTCSPNHSRQQYHFIYEFGVFVKLGEEVPDKVKTLDFGELARLLAPLRHLRPYSSKNKIAEYPDWWGKAHLWRVYDPQTEPDKQFVDLPSDLQTSSLIAEDANS